MFGLLINSEDELTKKENSKVSDEENFFIALL